MEYKRHLPHFDHAGKIFFVTFRLYNSIVSSTAVSMKLARTEAIDGIDDKLSEDEQRRKRNVIEAEYFKKYEGLLDHPTYGDRYLSEAECVNIMKDILHHLDGELYRLEAYCIMSNHVHILIDTAIQLSDTEDFNPNALEYQHLYKIMQRIKGRSAHYLNLARGTTGTTVWYPESYDRYIRNENHYNYTINYLLNNPIKANLVKNWTDWVGTYLRPCDDCDGGL